MATLIDGGRTKSAGLTSGKLEVGAPVAVVLLTEGKLVREALSRCLLELLVLKLGDSLRSIKDIPPVPYTLAFGFLLSVTVNVNESLLSCRLNKLVEWDSSGAKLLNHGNVDS